MMRSVTYTSTSEAIRQGCMHAAIPWMVMLMAVMFLAGCSHTREAVPMTARQKYMNEMKTLVSREVADPARADRVLALMDRMSMESLALKEKSVFYQHEFMRMNADYGTTPEQLQKIIDESLEFRMESRKKIMEDYFELKSLMTKKEWEAVSKGDVQAMAECLKASEESPRQ
ncbi:MAG TPA: hypothetical protein PLT09_05220 [Deltaproteobacteria bacterium]|nr:hypothetical protein [Deltaproteobacteria bacterium]